MQAAKKLGLCALGLSSLIAAAVVVFWMASTPIDHAPPSPPIAIAPVIDEAESRAFSDSVVEDLLNDDRDGLLSKLESSAREYYKTERFDTLMENLFDAFGKPLRVEYKKNMVGQKANAVGSVKPMRKFWYAVETTKFKIGTHFVFVEVVEEEKQLASSGFAIVHFPLGVPDDMK